MTKRILLALLVFSGCVTPAEKPLEPILAQPILITIWSDLVSSRKYFDKSPQEFARPAHARASDELIIATADGVVSKFQASNGKQLWQKRKDAAFHAGATTGNGSVFVASLSGDIWALDVIDGSDQWTASMPSSFETSPTLKQGRLFIQDINNTLYALDAATGKQLWTHRRDNPKFFTIKGSCEPTVTKDEVFCGYSDGYFVSLQIDTGEVLWEQNLSDGQTEFVDVDGSSVASNGSVFVASYAGGLYKLNKEDGETDWHLRARGIGDFAVRGDAIFLALSSRQVARVSTDDGAVLWSFKFRDTNPLTVLPVGDYLFVTTSGGAVYVLDGETGYTFQKWVGNTGVHAKPTFAANRLYFLSDGGEVTALKIGW